MASSNRHWPSMFKSKPTHHHQWQHDINSSLLSTGCLRSTPYTTGGSSGEERTPEPKPRWNPRPEQIRILEAIFNSGMVNPPRDEIRKIRAQLQEYGQVGDANVFYWFQNRKSRSKHKQRQQHLTQKPSPSSTNNSNNSSSSSNKSSPSPNNSAEKNKILSVGSTTTVIDLLNSPTASVNKPFFVPTSSTQTHNEFLTEPFYFAVPQHNTSISTTASAPQGFCFADHHNQTSNVIGGGECPSFLLNELMLMSSNTNNTTNGASKKVEDDDKIMKLHDQQIMNYASNTHTAAPPHQSLPVSTTLPSTNYIFQGVPESGPTKSTVFINDVCFEVGLGPFNIKEAFGDDAVLIQSNGQHVLTNEWGVTLQPLQHGAFYYLMRAFAPPHHVDDRTTIDLM